MIGTAVTVAAGVWLLFAEWVDSDRQRAVAKPLASIGFLLVPILEGTPGGPVAGWLIGGLVLGAVGDIALLGRSRSTFGAGLAAFLVGHIAYIVAFSIGGFSTMGLVVASVAMGTVSLLALRWLRPYLERPFDIAVPLYVFVIGVMVVTAIGSSEIGVRAKVGAMLFAASDLAVARERFVDRERWNRLVGLPLYYAAQLLIAWTATGSPA